MVGNVCVLSLLLFFIMTVHPKNKIMKFADDAALVGLTTQEDKMVYSGAHTRVDVQWPAEWSPRNKLRSSQTPLPESPQEKQSGEETAAP